MKDQLQVSLHEKFEIITLKKTIDDCTQIEDLKRITNQLIDSYFVQRTFLKHFMLEDLKSTKFNFNCNTDESSKVS
jgi:hypothetical protein